MFLKKEEIVGLTIEEYIPGDTLNLREKLNKISIFNE